MNIHVIWVIFFVKKNVIRIPSEKKTINKLSFQNVYYTTVNYEGNNYMFNEIGKTKSSYQRYQ